MQHKFTVSLTTSLPCYSVQTGTRCQAMAAPLLIHHEPTPIVTLYRIPFLFLPGKVCRYFVLQRLKSPKEKSEFGLKDQ